MKRESKSKTKSLKVNSDEWKQCKVENKSQELTFIGTLTCHPYLWVKSQHPGSIFVECKLRVRSWLPPDSVPTSYQFMTPSETRVTESVWSGDWRLGATSTKQDSSDVHAMCVDPFLSHISASNCLGQVQVSMTGKISRVCKLCNPSTVGQNSNLN